MRLSLFEKVLVSVGVAWALAAVVTLVARMLGVDLG